MRSTAVQRVFRHVESQLCERVDLRLRFTSGTFPVRIWQHQYGPQTAVEKSVVERLRQRPVSTARGTRRSTDASTRTMPSCKSVAADQTSMSAWFRERPSLVRQSVRPLDGRPSMTADACDGESK